jgi:hypothetical protein
MILCLKPSANSLEQQRIILDSLKLAASAQHSFQSGSLVRPLKEKTDKGMAEELYLLREKYSKLKSHNEELLRFVKVTQIEEAKRKEAKRSV